MSTLRYAKNTDLITLMEAALTALKAHANIKPNKETLVNTETILVLSGIASTGFDIEMTTAADKSALNILNSAQ